MLANCSDVARGRACRACRALYDLKYPDNKIRVSFQSEMSTISQELP